MTSFRPQAFVRQDVCSEKFTQVVARIFGRVVSPFFISPPMQSCTHSHIPPPLASVTKLFHYEGPSCEFLSCAITPFQGRAVKLASLLLAAGNPPFSFSHHPPTHPWRVSWFPRHRLSAAAWWFDRN